MPAAKFDLQSIVNERDPRTYSCIWGGCGEDGNGVVSVMEARVHTGIQTRLMMWCWPVRQRQMVVVVVVVVVVDKKRARKGAKAEKAPNSDEGTRSYCDGGKIPVI